MAEYRKSLVNGTGTVAEGEERSLSGEDFFLVGKGEGRTGKTRSPAGRETTTLRGSRQDRSRRGGCSCANLSGLEGGKWRKPFPAQTSFIVGNVVQ